MAYKKFPAPGAGTGRRASAPVRKAKRANDSRKPSYHTWKLRSRTTLAAALIPVIWLVAGSVQVTRFDMTKAYINGRRIGIPMGLPEGASFAAAHLELPANNKSYTLVTMTPRHFTHRNKHTIHGQVNPSPTGATNKLANTTAVPDTIYLEPTPDSISQKLGVMKVARKTKTELEVWNSQGRFTYKHRKPSILVSLKGIVATMTWVFQ